MIKMQLLRLLCRIAGGQDLEAEVARGGRRAGRLVLGNLAERHVGKDPEIFDRLADFDLLIFSPKNAQHLMKKNHSTLLRLPPRICPHPAAGTFRLANAPSPHHPRT